MMISAGAALAFADLPMASIFMDVGVRVSMRIPYYQVNAFTSSDFGGNPAGVCFLQDWLPDTLMQQIAAENDLAETAFLVRRDDVYDLRWMTPTAEVDLCGHATLAAAFVLFFESAMGTDQLAFQTLSGRLTATRLNDSVELDFPTRPPEKCNDFDPVARALAPGRAKFLKPGITSPFMPPQRKWQGCSRTSNCFGN